MKMPWSKTTEQKTVEALRKQKKALIKQQRALRDKVYESAVAFNKLARLLPAYKRLANDYTREAKLALANDEESIAKRWLARKARVQKQINIINNQEKKLDLLKDTVRDLRSDIESIDFEIKAYQTEKEITKVLKEYEGIGAAFDKLSESMEKAMNEIKTVEAEQETLSQFEEEGLVSIPWREGLEEEIESKELDKELESLKKEMEEEQLERVSDKKLEVTE